MLSPLEVNTIHYGNVITAQPSAAGAIAAGAHTLPPGPRAVDSITSLALHSTDLAQSVLPAPHH